MRFPYTSCTIATVPLYPITGVCMERNLSMLAATLGASLATMGCGAAPQQCTLAYPLTVSPLAATLDHASTAAANQVKFRGIAYLVATPATCPQRTDLGALEYATWTNPDPADIQISSAYDDTNGIASCTNATSGAVSLTGTFMPVKIGVGTVGAPDGLTHVVTVTLTCK